MIVRQFQLTDLPWVRQLYQDFLAERPHSYPTFGAEDLDHFVLVVAEALRTDETFHGTVALNGELLVGFMLGNLTRRLIGSPRMILVPHVLYVRPDHRGQGISRQMSGEFIAWYREHFPQVNELEIYSRVDDEQWHKRGFEPFLSVVHGSYALADRYIVGKPAPKEPKGKRKAHSVNGPDETREQE